MAGAAVATIAAQSWRRRPPAYCGVAVVCAGCGVRSCAAECSCGNGEGGGCGKGERWGLRERARGNGMDP